MDRIQLKRLTEAFKTSLLSKRSREVLVFLVFLVISAGFWLMLTLNDTYEVEIAYPLELVNVGDDAVITSELPSEVRVTLRDKGTSLIRYYARFHQPAVEIDFSAHDKGGSYAHVGIPHTEVRNRLQQLVDASTRIVSIRPDTLEYFFSRGVKKRVPVELKGTIKTDLDHYLAGVRCEPDSVTVWGEEHFLDTLTSVATVTTNINDLSASTKRQVALTAMRGTKTDPAEITLTVEVDRYTPKSVKVPIVGTNFPAGLSLLTFPPKATITFRVGSKDFRRFTADNFVLTATYEELMSLPDSMLHLRLRSVPEGISQVKIEPEAVQFLIEQTVEE